MRKISIFSSPFPSLYNQIMVALGTPILPSAAHREDRRLLSHLIDTRDTDCFSSGGYEFHLHHQTTIPVEARSMHLHINLCTLPRQWVFAMHAHKSYVQNLRYSIRKMKIEVQIKLLFFSLFTTSLICHTAVRHY